MKNRKLKTSIAIFLLLVSSGVFAQGPPGGGRGQGRDQQRGSQPDASEIFSKLDTNKDDLLNKDEASKDKRGKISEDFDEIDTNLDGFIDLEELKASLNDKSPKKISAEKILKEVDDNKDGTLNELEVAAKKKSELSNNFSKIDVNQDGELDIVELKAFYAANDRSKRKKRG